MLLSTLAERLPGGASVIGEDVSIDDVTHDSRAVKVGDLFVAVRGLVADGHEYVEAAIAAGAAAVAVDRANEASYSQLIVQDTRAALGPLAAAVHGEPSQRVAVVGVTGTNGKTTVTHLIESIVAAGGGTPGVIGTVGGRIAGQHVSVPRTTPEASDLQRLLARMVEAGVDVVAIEVSSHALALHRVDGVWFRVAAFTNLMQDHLDFHGDMDSYLAAKSRLFDVTRAERAVVDIDDEAGRSIAAAAQMPVTTVALDRASDITATDIEVTLGGSTFTVITPEGSYRASMPLPGRFNVRNALLAAAIARELQCTTETIAVGLAAVGVIPGRFEAVDEGQPFGLVVDYAHTPGAIAAMVESARRLTDGRVIALVGAGGDRDKAKRAAMGGAAAGADLVVLTSDNPRSEDPSLIISEVAAGLVPDTEALIEPDRRLAIRSALARAQKGDLVLILGKGHETGQDIDGTIHPFDDRLVAAQELRAVMGEATA
ncbi:MAG: UDP-N-acetylmuramoyl-L-alanyl-D-glutamate--2,6-diaminopimelate ligase [Acidimicrobiia bacterium]|nr:MAG: UDP-N-acetylmuramoyl-L-alanyl-D-glutamate--2,6-diaminopimelate ligase [Acidimicrobiia bacterium]